MVRGVRDIGRIHRGEGGRDVQMEEDNKTKESGREKQKIFDKQILNVRVSYEKKKNCVCRNGQMKDTMK